MQAQVASGSLDAVAVAVVASYAAQTVALQQQTNGSRLVLESGKKILGANSAVRFLAGLQKSGKSLLIDAVAPAHFLHDLWLERAFGRLKCAVHEALSAKQGVTNEQLLELLAELADTLGSKQFLFQDDISLADLAIFSVLYPVLGPKSTLSSIQVAESLRQWFGRISAMPSVLKGLKMANISSALDIAVSKATPAATEVRPVTRYQRPVMLPKEGERNILITSALPYVNNVPHLGNIIGSVLSADVYSRFCRQRGHNVVYICGTDEYGTATETKALEEGLTPRQICDKYNKIHREVYDWFDIDFDHFGRTSTDKQTEVAQDIFMNLWNSKHLLEESMDQLYCQNCSKFLADRFVEGTCTKCGDPGARGDQCDACGNLLNSVELINPKCKMCGTTPVVRSSEHLFLNLPELKPRLESWIHKSSEKGKWSSNSVQITNAWIRDGLKPRCITRDLKWGTPVPLEKYSEKVFYVWFDAPIGYISITASYTDQWQKWWKNPEKVELVQFMGKDNIPFHTVIFPSSLIGTEQPWTLLHHVSTTEYLNFEGGKFSKSRKMGVFGDNAKETGIPAEVWRYYLLCNRPENSDAVFQWDDFAAKNNNELLPNVGNLCQRANAFLGSKMNFTVPARHDLQQIDLTLFEQVHDIFKQYLDALEAVRLKEGLKLSMELSSIGNKYLQDTQPWKLVQERQVERAETVMNVVMNLIVLVGALLEPYMPAFTAKLFTQLNYGVPGKPLTVIGDIARANDARAFLSLLPTGHRSGTATPLFRKLEEAEIQDLRRKFAGIQVLENQPQATSTAHSAAPAAPVSGKGKKNTPKAPAAAADGASDLPVELQVGRLIEVVPHPSAETLFIVKVDLGANGVRQTVTGLRTAYTPEQLLHKPVVVLTNIKPSNFKGTRSECMVLLANGNKPLTVLNGSDAMLGAGVAPEGCKAPKGLKPVEGKLIAKLPFSTAEGGQVTFNGARLLANDVNVVAEETGAGAKIQ
eukprot:GILK01002458.1.p1 GENE.GILK01002458.1~~GILK01002458.1.p1  ORF type:complete len:998 (-),score=175.31 GILK01002458.1:102-3047(-)